MENKYKEGQIVYSRTDANMKLMIRRYVSRIYYCKVVDDPTRKELVFFERELTSGTED